MGAGDAPAEQTVDGDIFGVQVIGDAYFGGPRLCSFVDREGGDMRVFVDDPRRQVFTCAIDRLRAVRRGESFADLGDLSCMNEYIRTLQDSFFFIGPNGSVFDQQVFLGRQAIPAIPVEGIGDLADAGGS